MAEADGTWRLTGEKTWTTWLPNLTHAFVTARLDDTDPVEVGSWLVDLSSAEGVARLPGFEAMGMRGSASGRLVLDGVQVPADALSVRRLVDGARSARTGTGRLVRDRDRGDVSRGGGGRPDRRSPAGRSTAGRATARPRSPTSRASSFGSAALDADLRAARIVVLDVARRWDEAVGAGDAAALAAAAADVPWPSSSPRAPPSTATDEALRIAGGPGFLAGRLERAFRDARAGLINPPLEDVALTGFARAVLLASGRTGAWEPADPSRPTAGAPSARAAAFHYGPGHMIVHGNPAFIEAFGPTPSVSRLARRCSACRRRRSSSWISSTRRASPVPARSRRTGARRLVVAPRRDPETGEIYGVTTHLRGRPATG